jgi:hypothetical protein
MSFDNKYIYDVIILISYGNIITKTILPPYGQCQVSQFKSDHIISLNTKFTRVPRLPYSPDIAQSDFYFFSIIK